MKPHERHRSEARGPISFRVVTVSSSRHRKKAERKEFDDESGDVAVGLIEGAGNSVSSRTLIPDDRRMIQKAIREFLVSEDDVILFTGGTGVAKSDVTIEAARPFFEKELEGFGEFLRRGGYHEIGAAALLTRATAGVSGGKVILCLPGSPEAVRTAKPIIGELAHVVRVAKQ